MSIAKSVCCFDRRSFPSMSFIVLHCPCCVAATANSTKNFTGNSIKKLRCQYWLVKVTRSAHTQASRTSLHDAASFVFCFVAVVHVSGAQV